MRNYLLASVGLISLFLFGCTQQDRLFTPGKVSLEQLLASAPAPYVAPKPSGDIVEKTQEILKVHSLSVEKEVKAKEPVEIVFLLDNSYSMSDDLSKLRTAVATLQAELNKSEIDFRIRFLNMSQAKSFAGQRYGTAGAQGTIFSNLIFAAASPFTAPVFDRTSNAAALAQAAQSASTIDTSLQYEMGIGLAASFLNWNQLGTTETKAKLRPGHIHFVVISNEDNYRGFNNIRGANNVLLPLHTYTKNIYRGQGTKWGYCQDGGWTQKNVPSISAKRLRSATYYVKNSALAEVGQGTALSAPPYQQLPLSHYTLRKFLVRHQRQRQRDRLQSREETYLSRQPGRHYRLVLND